MRAMRAELGTTLRGYRVAARVGAALHRLADGEADLTRLALELGFASHAHLTTTFVRLLGAPPRELRRRLDPRARTFLEARRAATS
jgi:AraC-like DNA-binding protein